jgi:hypothetical protein
LPDNVSLSSIEAYAIDTANNVYGRLQKDVDSRTREVNCPVFNGRKEFRASQSLPWAPATTVVIRMDGIEHVASVRERRETRLGVVGFVTINLFIDPKTGLSPEDNAHEFALNAGKSVLTSVY